VNNPYTESLHLVKHNLSQSFSNL